MTILTLKIFSVILMQTGTIPPMSEFNMFLPFISNTSSHFDTFEKTITNHTEQCRTTITANSKLTQAAQWKSHDLSQTDIISHISSTGETENEIARRFGVPLHENNPLIGNTISSVGAGYKNWSTFFQATLNSLPHRRHVLGRDTDGTPNGFCQGLHVGLGFTANENGIYERYFVVYIAQLSS